MFGLYQEGLALAMFTIPKIYGKEMVETYSLSP